MPETDPNRAAPATAPARTELMLGTLVGGGAVMTIEILGTRLVSPVFGVGLFVWSALLAVTLAALAAGYYAGGLIVDRRPRLQSLAWALIVAGLLLAGTRLVQFWLLGACEGLGPRLGPLVCASFLVGPPLTALGTVGPITVRLITDAINTTGRRVGFTYAVSTLGSLIATLLVGFVLIPQFDTNTILTATATLLIAVGALIFGRRGHLSTLALLLVPTATTLRKPPSLPAGIEQLARAQSPLGLIEVIEDHRQGVRMLRADHSIIGAQFVRDHSTAFAFLHILEAARYFNPAARDMLQIGLGIGSVPAALDQSGIRANVVEIDPVVARFAKDYFQFSVSGQTHIQDARTFLQGTSQQYDLIIHDSFTGGATPEHLLSVEFMHRIRARLRPGGVLALNFAGYVVGPDAEASRMVARTLRSTFQHVRAFRDGPPQEHTDEPSNIIFFAADHELDFQLPPHATFENKRCERTQRAFIHWEVLRETEPGGVATDAHNPLERLQLPTAEAHFYAMRELLPKNVWLQ